jgi:gliding motility-associated lipoprotein GldD
MKQINPHPLLALGRVCLAAIFLCACSGKPLTPKPHGYLRVDFPEKQYRLFDTTGFPYRFACPTYARIVPDRQSHAREPYWINIQLPACNATLHISYKQIHNNLNELLNDTHNFVYRHVIKADAISERPFENETQKVSGFLYELGGEVASPVQFYATDSTKNFLRGSLYFMATPNADSLAPSITFLLSDIEHLMETLEWK